MLLILLLAFTNLSSTQDHGSPNPPPPQPTILDPSLPSSTPKDFRDPNLVLGPLGPNATPGPQQPTFAPGDISMAPWVDPATIPPGPSPSPEPESSPGDIYICTDTDFQGTCEYIHSVTYQCHNFAPHFKKQLSSIRPDKGQLCLFYEDEECKGKADWIRWPGSANMRGRRFDNRASSWYCTEDGCDGVQGPGGCRENADGSPKAA